MSSRSDVHPLLCTDRERVVGYCLFYPNGSGTVAAVDKSGGAASVARTGTGAFTITLEDTWMSIENIHASVSLNTQDGTVPTITSHSAASKTISLKLIKPPANTGAITISAGTACAVSVANPTCGAITASGTAVAAPTCGAITATGTAVAAPTCGAITASGGSFVPATITTADATDDATCQALANAIKAAINSGASFGTFTQPTISTPTITQGAVTDPTISTPTITQGTVTQPTISTPTITQGAVTVTQPTFTAAAPTITHAAADVTAHANSYVLVTWIGRRCKTSVT